MKHWVLVKGSPRERHEAWRREQIAAGVKLYSRKERIDARTEVREEVKPINATSPAVKPPKPRKRRRAEPCRPEIPYCEASGLTRTDVMLDEIRREILTLKNQIGRIAAWVGVEL